MTAPLIVTSDEPLLEDLLRLCAAAGVVPDVAREPALALRDWSTAPVVLVGADRAEQMIALRPARRTRVHLLCRGVAGDGIYRAALDLGAEVVASLPASEEWLVEALTDLGEQRATPGLTIGVVAGSGGAGATTFACALGQVAGRAGPSLVVDADPFGAGVDRMLGFDLLDGVRWGGLQQTTGRLGARALRDAVPRQEGVGVLTWAAGTATGLAPFAMREALSAAQRGHDAVVIDLPRRVDDLVAETMARCDAVLVVARPTLLGLAAAGRLCAAVADYAAPELVLRGTGLTAQEAVRVAGRPVLTQMRDQRGLAESVDLGLGPVRSLRGPLARAATGVLHVLSEADGDRAAA